MNSKNTHLKPEVSLSWRKEYNTVIRSGVLNKLKVCLKRNFFLISCGSVSDNLLYFRQKHENFSQFEASFSYIQVPV